MKTAVSVRGLRREYGDVVALDGLDLTIETGTITALVGPNGAGKTTLLRVLAGILAPTVGSLSVMDIEAAADPRALRALVGYLPDHFGIFDDLTPRQFLRYFARAYGLWSETTESRLVEVLTEVGLLDKADEPTEGLSRGMKQRLGVARTVLHSPALLLLDEPASGLDPGSRRDLQNLLRRYAARGTTIIVSSHILAELEEYCTHIAVLDRGRLVHHGAADGRGEAAHRRRFTLRLVSGAAPITLVAGRPGVGTVVSRGGALEFEFDGDDAAAAALLKDLVSTGAQLLGFAEMAEGLQDRYLTMIERRD